MARVPSELRKWVLKVGCTLEALVFRADPVPGKAIAHKFYYPLLSFPFRAMSVHTKQSGIPAVPDLEN